MKSDRPFWKGLVWGGLLLAVVFLFALSVTSYHEHYYLQYFRIFLITLPPAIITPIWAFFSRKTWTWRRFSIVTIIFFFACLILIGFCANFLPNKPLPLPVITFSPEISSSWTVEPEPPIIDMTKIARGQQMGLRNEDQKRWIWIGAQNSPEDFDPAVVDWRSMLMEKARDGGYQVHENKLTEDVKAGRKIARVYLALKKDGANIEDVNEAWMQGRFFVMCEVMGTNVQNDQEIAAIFSSIVVK